MAVTVVNSGFKFGRSSGGGEKAPHHFSYVVFPRHSMQPSSDGMRYLISPGRLRRSRSPRHDRQGTKSASEWAQQLLTLHRSCIHVFTCLNNALNDQTVLQKLSHSATSESSALSLRFIFSVALIDAAIPRAGRVLHQLAVGAARGEAFKGTASTPGCGWMREMAPAESCCVVWPPNGLRVDCGGQLADEVAGQRWGGGWGSARSTHCQMTHLARTMLASVGAPPFPFCVLIPGHFVPETFLYCWFWIWFWMELVSFRVLQYLPLRRKISFCFGCHVSTNTRPL